MLGGLLLLLGEGMRMLDGVAGLGRRINRRVGVGQTQGGVGL